MRRRFIALLAATAAFAMIGVATALAVGVPEIDNANATFQVKPTSTPVVTSCNGEDATTYKKITSVWKGGEIDFPPGSTDYNLSGNLKLNGVWTINTGTGRGIFRANVQMITTAGTPGYKGTLVLITQTNSSAVVPARGWLSARTYGGDPPNPPGNLDGGSVLANVEAQINTTGFSITGMFGDAPPQLGGLDWSVTTINQTC